VLRLEHNGISSRVFVADGWREGAAAAAQPALATMTQTLVFRE